MQKALRSFDFSKSLMWDLPECMDQFKDLVDNPPLHSVVAHIEPAVAKAILRAANDRNRPLNKGATNNVKHEIDTGEFELTGDTLKISKRGRLIDGQHRLSGCVAAGKGIQTHIVFGLPDTVFDILDRQRTRTAADVLSVGGVKDAIVVAGATRWGKIISERRRGLGGGGRSGRRPSPRETRKLVAGPMRDLPLYAKSAETIRKAYKIPPTIVCGLLWCIGQGDKTAAETFAAEWLNGNRNYSRNKNFDVMQQRIVSVRAQSNGHLNRTTLAAMLVQCFNHWHAGVTATPRSMTWKREWAFPALAFDKAAFMKSREEGRLSDTSLKASQARVLEALTAAADKARKVKASNADIAKRANVVERQIPYVLRTLVEARQIYVDKKGGPGNAVSVYRLPEPVTS